MLADTYDILNCGPRNRFIANGKLVSNCNWQNLKRGSDIRKAIHAPPGYQLIIADLAQIEARINAWTAGQSNIVSAFHDYDVILGYDAKGKPIRKGPDIYRLAAALIFGRRPEDVTDAERFIGKTCIAEGTPVLCKSGWKPIETITERDRVWDGENWRKHQGLLSTGLKETTLSCGVWLTPDHKIFTGVTWKRADELLHDENTRCQTLAYAAEKLPSVVTSSRFAASARLSLAATAACPSTRSTYTTSALSKALAATYALMVQRTKNGTGCTAKRCRTMNTVRGFLTGSAQRLADAITLEAAYGKATAAGASTYTKSGATIGALFYSISKQLLAGIFLPWRSTGSTSTEDTNPETSVLPPAVKTQPTSGESTISKRLLHTYDLSSVAETNRFVVCGENGPLLVHNCVLGLGYGAGAPKFATMLKTAAGAPKEIVITDAFARDIHSAWRQSNQAIVANWKATGNKFKQAWLSNSTVEDGIVSYERSGDNMFMHMPGGMAIRYDGVELNGNDMDYIKVFRVNKTKEPTVVRGRLYGGLLVENRTQGFARRVVAEHALAIADEVKSWQLVMTTHDELVGLVPNRSANKALKIAKAVMSQAPSCAPGLPIAVDAHISQRYDK